MKKASAALMAVGAVIGIITGVLEITHEPEYTRPLAVDQIVKQIDTVNVTQAPLVSVKVEGEAVSDGIRAGVGDLASRYLPTPKLRADAHARPWWRRALDAARTAYVATKAYVRALVMDVGVKQVMWMVWR